jgi:C-terminal processing protease CtpA/Prc
VDGEVLEAKGVPPDLAVPFDLRHAGGRDPQLEAALDAARAGK